MNDYHVDYESGTVYAKLTAHPAKQRGPKVTLTEDITWPIAGPTTIKAAVIYGDVRVRDWRWLWLRKKTITIPFAYQMFDLD